MNRRRFLKRAATIPIFAIGCSPLSTSSAKRPFRRVRPGDPEWPSAASWEEFNRRVEGRLVKVQWPVASCQNAPDSPACTELFKQLKNPYYIGGQPGLTQSSGWIDAWTSAPSVYAVAAAKTEDVVAAVNFAREKNLRLVVKGGGHSYLGTSSAPDSLLIWTRAMKQITLHDTFVAKGCERTHPPQPAVSLGAGTIWMQAYDAVTTKSGRYVQGGGCTTVGVAGLVQSGGFGSFSKNYGMAAAGLLEAEVVTADGAVRIANACTHPDLFWGLKGGGGGSLGVVTRLTLRTRELPEYFGGIFGTIKATSDSAFRQLTAEIIRFYHEHLFNRHWGEQIHFGRDNRVRISMVSQGLNRQQATGVWQPFFDWVAASPREFQVEGEMLVLDIPARKFWDADHIQKNYPQAIMAANQPDVPASHFFWAGNQEEAGQVVNSYRSAWLPASLLEADRQSRLAHALFAGSRHWGISLHFNKGLAGASVESVTAAKDTATNPAVVDAFALAIIASIGPPAFAGIRGHEPDIAAGRQQARRVYKSMDELLRIIPEAGSYVSETDFFERSWRESFWGSNYPRLAAVKKKYDPAGLFFVHHGVGSEEWSADGFTKLASGSTSLANLG